MVYRKIPKKTMYLNGIMKKKVPETLKGSGKGRKKETNNGIKE
jgi:hypothetical protein